MDRNTSPSSPRGGGTSAGAAPRNAKPGRWISLSAYQALYGYNRVTIKRHIRLGTLQGRWEGNKWLVWDDAEPLRSGNAIESVAFVTVNEAAQVMKAPVRTVQYWIAHQQMKAVRVGGRDYTTVAEIRRMIHWRANKDPHAPRKKHVREAVVELVREKLLGTR